MALRDTWHRTLVYFGLAEDRYDDDDYDEPARSGARPANPEAELEDRYRERPNVRRLSVAPPPRRDRRHLRRRPAATGARTCCAPSAGQGRRGANGRATASACTS